MRQYFNIDPNGALPHKDVWRHNTELMIATISVMFSIAILLLYKGGVEISSSSKPVIFVQSLIFTFPVICLVRLGYVKSQNPAPWFGWASPTIDIIILSIIIYAFSWQYGEIAASYKAPTFSFYFVMIALHSMRFNPRQTILCGITAALSWGIIIASFKMGGAETTHSYSEFITSSKLLLGAEVERMIALLTFAGFLAIGALRADRLMAYEKEMEMQVTEINHQASLARVQLEEAKKTSQIKSDFLDTMSHEMRTPMNGVMGMIQVLEQTELTDKQRYMLSVMDKSSEAMLKIIQDILDFATLNGNHVTLKSEPFTLKTMVEDAVKIPLKDAQAKGLEFFIQIDPHCPEIIYGDDHYTALIIEKLSSNAVKFTNHGYIRLHIEDKTSAVDIKQGRSTIGITLQDTGIGMSEADRVAIFQAFSQADTSKTRAYGGMGIGLSLVQKLMQAMDTTLKLTSTLGKGTSFSFDMTWSAPDDLRKDVDGLKIHAEEAKLSGLMPPQSPPIILPALSSTEAPKPPDSPKLPTPQPPPTPSEPLAHLNDLSSLIEAMSDDREDLAAIDNTLQTDSAPQINSAAPPHLNHNDIFNGVQDLTEILRQIDKDTTAPQSAVQNPKPAQKNSA